MKAIPYGKQEITAADISAVVEVLQADYLTQGPKIAEFEEKFAQYVGASYAVALSNGTAALHLGALALGLKPGQKVITTPITFVASTNCVGYCGGEVDLVDIDPSTYLIDISAIRSKLANAPSGTYAGIIPVDFAGRAVDLEELRVLADEFGLWIMEDACHAPGAYFVDQQGKAQLVGNGNFAHLTVFSFHPVKHIACGEGGMITTNDKVLYEHLLSLRTHGITRNQAQFHNSAALATADEETEAYPGWYMEMQELGYNYRLTDIQAALGVSQLAKADERLVRRRAIAEKYDEVFKTLSFIKGHSGKVDGHAYHLYIIEVEERLALYNFLRKHQVFTQIHYIPVHLMPYYQEQGYSKGDFPHAENYYANCLSLPMYPTLSNEEQEHVINLIQTFFSTK